MVEVNLSPHRCGGKEHNYCCGVDFFWVRAVDFPARLRPSSMGLSRILGSLFLTRRFRNPDRPAQKAPTYRRVTEILVTAVWSASFLRRGVAVQCGVGRASS